MNLRDRRIWLVGLLILWAGVLYDQFYEPGEAAATSVVSSFPTNRHMVDSGQARRR